MADRAPHASRVRPHSRRSLRRLGCALALVVASPAFLTHAASAQSKAKAKAQAPAADTGGLSLEEIAVMLSSSVADEVIMAIEASAMLNNTSAAPLLLERIRAGLPPDMLEAALDALAALNSPASREVFIQMSRHRREAVRVRSARALGAHRDPESEAALVRALSDSSPSVREAAAESLGKVSSSSNLNPLFAAFDRGVVNAGRAIARLASDEQVPRITGLLGRVPFTSLTPVFDTLLSRRDISEGTKLSLVAQVADLGTADARGYFEALRTKLPEDAPPRVRKAIEEAAARIAQ